MYFNDTWKYRGYTIKLIPNGGISCYQVWIDGLYHKYANLQQAQRAVDYIKD